jgi:hypothetical protein
VPRQKLRIRPAPRFSSTITLYDKWAHIDDRYYDERTAERRAIARDQHLFNTLQIPITGVGGLNDALNQPVIHGFCGTCHDSPNLGDHCVPAPLNIGLSDASRRTPDLPLVTVKCKSGQVLQVTDIGRAMVTGNCADVQKDRFFAAWRDAHLTSTTARPLAGCAQHLRCEIQSEPVAAG